MYTKSKIEKKNDWIVVLLMTVIVCAWGGIYDFSAAIYGVIFCIGIFLLMKKNKEVLISLNVTSIALCLLAVGFLLSCFAARDKGMALIGVLQIIVLIGFWILWCNLPSDMRKKIWGFLPHIVSVITFASILLYIVPFMRDYLFHAGRLGGVFQYSNTYAVFLLISMILILCEKRRTKNVYVELTVMIVGILLCGSRSAAVLMIAVWICLLIWKKIDWKLFLYMLVVIGIAVILVQCVAVFDLQRLLKLSLQSSTLNGRFLYWQDALPILANHPLGLGYMGYYFLQPQFQTGNYVTKYVHNDFLQFGLDGGWLALAALVLLVLNGIFNKKQTGVNRFIIIILAAHAMFDFDLQYMCMFFLLLMCMNTDTKRQWIINRRALKYGACAAAVVYGYFSFALGLEHAGADRMAVKIYPWNTFARETLVVEQDDTESAKFLTEKNGMLASAYECMARDAIQQEQFDEACDSIDSMLLCAGYESYYYNQAVYYWSICLDSAYRSQDAEETRYILEKIKQMPEMVAQKEAEASELAYRINDKPKIVLEEAVLDYIQKMERASMF